MSSFAQFIRPPSASHRELLDFTRQFAILVRSGIGVVRSFHVLETQCPQASLRVAAHRARRLIEDGATITAALRLTPTIFPATYTSLISAGERSGTLDQSLQTICRDLESAATLRTRMITAAIYPCVVLCTLAAVTAFLLIWVVPMYEDLFSDSHATLPFITRVVIEISKGFCAYGPMVGLLCSVLGVLGYGALRASSTRTIAHRVLFATPLVGPLIRKRHAAHFSRLLSSLIGAGLSVLDALAILRDTSWNEVCKRDIAIMEHHILEGYSLSHACDATSSLPALVSQMIAIGEESGQLQAMLMQSAAVFEREIETTIENFKQTIGPCLILSIGALVGTLVVAMYLPIFELGGVIVRF